MESSAASRTKGGMLVGGTKRKGEEEREDGLIRRMVGDLELNLGVGVDIVAVDCLPSGKLG